MDLAFVGALGGGQFEHLVQQVADIAQRGRLEFVRLVDDVPEDADGPLGLLALGRQLCVESIPASVRGSSIIGKAGLTELPPQLM